MMVRHYDGSSCGVSWLSGLAYRTQVLVLEAECGFENKLYLMIHFIVMTIIILLWLIFRHDHDHHRGVNYSGYDLR